MASVFGFRDKHVAVALREFITRGTEDRVELSDKPMSIPEMLHCWNLQGLPADDLEHCPGGACTFWSEEFDHSDEGLSFITGAPSSVDFRPHRYIINLDEPEGKTSYDKFFWGSFGYNPVWALAHEDFEINEVEPGSSWGPYLPDNEGGRSWKIRQHYPGFIATGELKHKEVDGENNLYIRVIQRWPDKIFVRPAALIPFMTFGQDLPVMVGEPGLEFDSNFRIESAFNGVRDIPSDEPSYVSWINGHAYVFPIYNQITLTVKPLTTIEKGQSGQCLLHHAGVPTGTQVFCKALGARVVAGKWAVAWQETASGQWYVGPWECG